MSELRLSALAKTWILDLDGTILKHNGYKIDGIDTFLEGAEEFLKSIPEEDMVIFLTSRTDQEREATEAFLRDHHIRYNQIIFNAPYGERILINDRKPSGLVTSLAIDTERDKFCKLNITIDHSL
ncbi:hypothetical protein [Brevibacillus fulvus]|uniref:Ribonucleotide monophosphatase NagD (HAD superfamily) n=1 Tax=Brevibacillus fulvus TaxID=1125967 RepID=A0A939BTL3_9BACL|nr:hypothetical protein [Brevibacillus fulvus]MBM7589594.1 ribonucleotide monophosphatase NagD (HAD superfamily) [Brevibacillus fulvus]